jgi:hypothetical protein
MDYSPISWKLEELESKCIWDNRPPSKDGHNDVQNTIVTKKNCAISFTRRPWKLTLVLVVLSSICKRHCVELRKFGLKQQFQDTEGVSIKSEISRICPCESSFWKKLRLWVNICENIHPYPDPEPWVLRFQPNFFWWFFV